MKKVDKPRGFFILPEFVRHGFINRVPNLKACVYLIPQQTRMESTKSDIT